MNNSIPQSNSLAGKWEQRWHPLWRQWVVYAAHRNFRPWSGASVSSSSEAPVYDPKCYLCPGNPRVHGDRNPDYREVFVFDNDHPVVGLQAPEIQDSISPRHQDVFQRRRAYGLARVVCYDPRHNVTLAQLPLSKVYKVFEAWREQVGEIKQIEGIRSILIFENKGKLVGVSNPHPHCQLYATNFIFHLVERELESATIYKKDTNRNVFEDVLSAEMEDGSRILFENENAVAFVPFFARYAYETLIFPKRRHGTMISLSDEELKDLAQAFQQVIRCYDLLYNMSFPYVMSILQAPLDEGDYSEYHMHLMLQPPLRQPGLQKFLAGPEIGGGTFMADTMPEEKAKELQSLDMGQFIEMD